MGLPAQHCLRQRREFLAVHADGYRVSCGPFIFQCLPARRVEGRSEADPCRLGLVASRKVGNAVARNLGKRRFRALFHRHVALLPPGSDLVIILRSGVSERPFSELEQRFLKACHNLPRSLWENPEQP